MIQSKKLLIIFLLVPVIALATLTAYKKSIVTFGREVILPISGYDPRDLLSGHYLIYRVDYGIETVCDHKFTPGEPAYLCLTPRMFSFFPTHNCDLEIIGACNNSRFEAGIEKFYVPQEKALELEKLIQSKKAGIKIAVTPDGKAQVKDLLIDGKPWTEMIAKEEK